MRRGAASCAGMIKVVGIVILSALFLGESSIFTTRQAPALCNCKAYPASPHAVPLLPCLDIL